MENMRFIDNGDGTITDIETDFMWLKDAGNIKSMPWQEAVYYCQELNFAGYTDWRLPTIEELINLIDYNNYNPALPSGHPFLNPLKGSYWSSTTYANDIESAWYIYLSNGMVSWYDKSGKGYIWVVRETLK